MSLVNTILLIVALTLFGIHSALAEDKPWECTERGTAVFGHRGPVSAQDLLNGQEECRREAELVEQTIKAGA